MSSSDLDKQLQKARDRLEKLRAAMGAEMQKALNRPRSPHGGPVRIASGVPMRFPYTFTAKVMQFPWKYYYNHNAVFKYYLIAVVMCMPIFQWISSKANSEGNVRSWERLCAQNAAATAAHHRH